MSVGVIVGRFQVHEIHEGHLQLLEYVQKKHDNTLILLGVRHVPSNKNYPLDFESRRMMMQEYCPNALVLPVIDRPSDEAWSKQVDDLVKASFPTQDVTLYGGRDSFIKHYCGVYQTKELNFTTDELNATAIRKQIGLKVRGNADFRAGMIYAIENLMPRIYPTVDIAIVDEANKKVLLAKKHFEKAYRFPGGFVDFKDKSFEVAAKREMSEETGLSCEGEMEYIGSFSIPDWRNTEDTCIVTTFFYTPYCYGPATANDDIESVEWVSFKDLLNVNMVNEHRDLRQALLSYIGKKALAK